MALDATVSAARRCVSGHFEFSKSSKAMFSASGEGDIAGGGCSLTEQTGMMPEPALTLAAFPAIQETPLPLPAFHGVEDDEEEDEPSSGMGMAAAAAAAAAFAAASSIMSKTSSVLLSPIAGFMAAAFSASPAAVSLGGPPGALPLPVAAEVPATVSISVTTPDASEGCAAPRVEGAPAASPATEEAAGAGIVPSRRVPPVTSCPSSPTSPPSASSAGPAVTPGGC